MQSLVSFWDETVFRTQGKKVILFLDYDGTLTPIVEHPQDAKLSLQRRKILRQPSTPQLKMFLRLCQIAS